MGKLQFLPEGSLTKLIYLDYPDKTTETEAHSLLFFR